MLDSLARRDAFKQPLKNSALEVAFTPDGTLKSITHTADSVSVAAQQQY
eukprot:COSAG04_NODE_13917_length_587_cov_0.854508_2_plen_48_part_01